MKFFNSPIFQYPYVMITIFVFVFIVMGLIGLYFMMKSVRTSKGTVAKNFCALSKIENDFVKAENLHENRTVVYISVALDGMKRLYSESKAIRIYEQLKHILFKHLCLSIDGDISVYSDENFVAFNSLHPEKIAQRIDKCYEEINDTFIEYDVVNVVQVRFGYFCSSSNEVPFETALSRAKQACSIAENKDSLYCQWDTSNGKEFERKLKIENNIQGEIDNNRFFLEYQPIVDTQTSSIVGAEVLSRLNSEGEGVIPPNFFLSAVNNVGLNEKFDYYIFEKNCKWISSDINTRGKYVYTINFSRQTLCGPNFPENIIRCVEAYGINFSCIAVEILEDKSLTEEAKSVMMQNLIRLKNRGILIFLDDFGTGFTSFSDLAKFDIDIVKIDKAITQGAVNPVGNLILKNMIKTAHDLGYKTICEGVETEEHKKAAEEAGSDMLQGYYFYHPMPVTKLEVLLKNA